MLFSMLLLWTVNAGYSKQTFMVQNREGMPLWRSGAGQAGSGSIITVLFGG